MNVRPVLVDLYCSAGGATRGYQNAGFYVIGVDKVPQPNYCGDAFVCMDALAFLRLLIAGGGTWNGRRVVAAHASPPCQADLRGLASANAALGRDYAHESLTDATRALLLELGVPYVIEQPQQGARLRAPVVYCGTSFGLPVYRHRQFECSVLLLVPPCEHDRQREAKYWTGYGTDWGGPKERERARKLAKVVQVYGNGGDRELWPAALGIDWMTPDELTQAIPPAYTEHIGRQLLAILPLAA